MTTTGERLTAPARRVHTPTADELAAGAAIDAGIAQILSHNLAHLQLERALRACAFSLGPGSITNDVRGFDGLTDRPDPTGGAGYSGTNEVSWDRRTAQRFGPFLAIADREVSGEARAPRKLRVCVDCEGSALRLLVAITAPSELPSAGAYVFAQQVVTSGARGVVTIDLEPEPIDGTAWPARRAAPDDEDAGVFPFALWLGWYSASGSSAIYAVTVQEIR